MSYTDKIVESVQKGELFELQPLVIVRNVYWILAAQIIKSNPEQSKKYTELGDKLNDLFIKEGGYL